MVLPCERIKPSIFLLELQHAGYKEHNCELNLNHLFTHSTWMTSLHPFYSLSLNFPLGSVPDHADHCFISIKKKSWKKWTQVSWPWSTQRILLLMRLSVCSRGRCSRPVRTCIWFPLRSSSSTPCRWENPLREVILFFDRSSLLNEIRWSRCVMVVSPLSGKSSWFVVQSRLSMAFSSRNLLPEEQRRWNNIYNFRQYCEYNDKLLCFGSDPLAKI